MKKRGFLTFVTFLLVIQLVAGSRAEDTLQGRRGEVNPTLYSLAATASAIGLSENIVRLPDSEIDEPVSIPEGYEVHSVCFSPDGKLLAFGASDNTVKLWDVAVLPFSRDGVTLASGSVEDTVESSGTETPTVIATFEGHTDDVLSAAFFS